MKKGDCSCTMWVNRMVAKKLSYVAEYDGLSRNREMQMLMQNRIAEFEAEHGEIPISLSAEEEEG